MREKGFREERKIVLGYLCGLSDAFIQKKWRSSPLVTENLVKGSSEWKDSLVEFYRQTTNRLKNSAHLYLAFNNVAVPKEELLCVFCGSTESIYENVKKEIYAPKIEEIIREIDFSLPLPKNKNVELLIYQLFERTPEEHIEPLLIDRLCEEYQKEDNIFSLDNVFTDTKKILINKIEHGRPPITPERMEILYKVLADIPRIEEHLITLRYGLKDGKPKTLAEIGEMFYISKERVRQIVQKGIRRLRHPRILERLEIFDEPFSNKYNRSHLFQCKEALLNEPVEYLYISTRIENCLNRAGIRSIRDLMQKQPKDLLVLPNFGMKSLREVEEKLAKIGFSLRRDE